MQAAKYGDSEAPDDGSNFLLLSIRISPDGIHLEI
jgi:hypothetical protein